MHREPTGLVPKPFVQRDGVSDRTEVGEGFWIFVQGRWAKVWQQNWQQLQQMEWL